MRLFATIGKVFDAIGQSVDVMTNGVSIVGDWVDLGKNISDSEIDMIKKEMDVNVKIRQMELEKRLQARLSSSGLAGA